MESESDAYMVESDYADEEEDFFDSEDEEEVSHRPKAKMAPAAKAKKVVKSSSLKTVLSPRNVNLVDEPSAGAASASETVKPAAKKGSKTVEEIYQKKTQLEHILLRPDTYIGSTQRDSANMYILKDDKVVERDIMFTPGLYKIFDEIVVNAADNKQRDSNMDKIEIDIDAANNVISVKNNGKGIPIVMHKEHKVYVPTLIFGHLLTGSNFDDDEKKTTGGRNGYGAKLANVFSTMFKVECVDAEQGMRFSQVFRDNMSVAEKPKVTSCTGGEKKQGDYVKITFSPDLARFGMTHLDDNTVALLSKRAYDIAGTMASRGGKKLAVKLAGNKLPIKSFKDYLGLFQGLAPPVAYEKNDRWEVGVSASGDASPHQVSFVNSICTSKGGGHVSYIADQIAAHLVKVFGKKKKKLNVKPAQVKNHLTVFVNCLVENPTFDSQTKEFMTSKPRTFGSSCKLSEKFLKSVEKSEIVTTIESYLTFREKEALKRKGGTKKTKITGITKLDDANHAGTAKSKDCTLIITEGDSAKSLAMAGLSVVGRDVYGVFPLRGKPLNVRDSTHAQVGKNEEIKNLVEILGLKFGMTYDETNIKNLRYGHLMIMADQDTDGSHIKGLVVNFIHNFWPSLLDVPGFLQQFITPIIKVTKGRRSISFFSLPEYQHWLESTGNNGKGYSTKYYKGLGTSTSAEAKEYFSHLDLHEVHFGKLCKDLTYPENFDDLEDGDPLKKQVEGSDLIDMVFRKDRVEDRKKWLNATARDAYMDYRKVSEAGGVQFSEFINKEYVHFSNYDNERSIPCSIDGLKPSQRKVLYACFKRKLKNEIKVAQLTGYIAEHSAYHHGEASLQQTIINMAQNFCGSNNINLLTPSGQFGTRRMGGKDAASPRYIFTSLEKITRKIFHPDDDDLLQYLVDDGASIEPQFYVPVIPMVLVNGSDGIGTGWSSTVCNYNPREIIANLRRKIAGEKLQPMMPYYAGFTGEITHDEKKTGSFQVKGKIERVNDTTLIVSELPLKKWTQDYKQFLEGLMTGQDKKTEPLIKDFRENHTETTVSFTVTADASKIDQCEKDVKGLMGKFKLNGSLSTSNMNLFNTEGQIIKYPSPASILSEFYDIRLEYYAKRKEMLVGKLRSVQRMLSNKARFVEEVCDGKLVVSNRKRNELLTDLNERGYDLIQKTPEKGTRPGDDGQDNSDEDDSSLSDLSKGFDYLLGMKIWTLTFEKAEALRAELADKTMELEQLEATEPSKLWLNDLDEIEEAMDERDTDLKKSVAEEKRAQQKSKKRQAKAKKNGKRKGSKKIDDWDSDLESSSDEDAEMEDSDSDNGAAMRTKKMGRAGGRKPAAKTNKAVPKAAPTVRPKFVPVPMGKKLDSRKSSGIASKESSDESEDEFGGTLMERMRKKLVVSPPGRKKSVKKRPSPKINENETDSDASVEDLTELDAEMFDLASVTPAKKKVTAKVSQATKRGRGKNANKVALQKQAQQAVDLDDEDSDMEIETTKPTAGRSRRGRAASKSVDYALSEDDSDYVSE